MNDSLIRPYNSIPETVKVDPVSSTLQYIGYTTPGTATSESRWKMSKITIDGSGNITDVQWAYSVVDGIKISGYRFAYNDRASLTYG